MIALSLLLSVAALVDPPVQYDCQAEKQLVLQSDQGDWNYSAGDVDPQQREVFRWTFVAAKSTDGAITVTHDPGILDALGLGGTYKARVIAPGQFAFATEKAQNCLFTELACGALVEISDIDEDSASFSLVPMGSVKMQDGSREILQFVMLGTCQKLEVEV